MPAAGPASVPSLSVWPPPWCLAGGVSGIYTLLCVSPAPPDACHISQPRPPATAAVTGIVRTDYTSAVDATATGGAGAATDVGAATVVGAASAGS